jgi:hypothetical protein
MAKEYKFLSFQVRLFRIASYKYAGNPSEFRPICFVAFAGLDNGRTVDAQSIISHLYLHWTAQKNAEEHAHSACWTAGTVP